MRWFFAIPIILFGAFLLSLTIDEMGNIGHLFMKIKGFGCFIIAGFIVRTKNEKSKQSPSTN